PVARAMGRSARRFGYSSPTSRSKLFAFSPRSSQVGSKSVRHGRMKAEQSSSWPYEAWQTRVNSAFADSTKLAEESWKRAEDFKGASRAKVPSSLGRLYDGQRHPDTTTW